MPTVIAAEQEVAAAFGVELTDGDFFVQLVVKSDGTNEYKFAKYEKDSVSGNLTWVQYQLNNGEFKKA